MIQFKKHEYRKQRANRSIWVRFQREGIHSYPAAAENHLQGNGKHFEIPAGVF